MSYSITCSTKILTLAIALFLFISIGVLCEFAMVFYSPLRKSWTLLPEGTDIHILQHIYQKDLIFCLPLYYYAMVIFELGKTQTRNSTVLWCLA